MCYLRGDRVPWLTMARIHTDTQFLPSCLLTASGNLGTSRQHDKSQMKGQKSIFVLHILAYAGERLVRWTFIQEWDSNQTCNTIRDLSLQARQSLCLLPPYSFLFVFLWAALETQIVFLLSQKWLTTVSGKCPVHSTVASINEMILSHLQCFSQLCKSSYCKQRKTRHPLSIFVKSCLKLSIALYI